MATRNRDLPQITVVVPVGPNKVYRQWLGECLDSIRMQTYPAHEIILIDDMAHLDERETAGCKVYKNPWLIGCGLSWNFGVALSATNCVFLMGSDDGLMPECLEACALAYSDPYGYYNVTCIDSNGTVIDLFNNAAMVTKKLWALTGGFPITSTVGAPDGLLLSILIKHFPQHLHQVRKGEPLYWVRVHPDQDTRRYASVFHQQVIDIRNIETARWRRPEWTDG